MNRIAQVFEKALENLENDEQLEGFVRGVLYSIKNFSVKDPIRGKKYIGGATEYEMTDGLMQAFDNFKTKQFQERLNIFRNKL